jgi:ribosomal-protein-alanine N-acetyltransferase
VIELLTERLRLRRLDSDDLDDLWRLDSDPRVMRFIGDGPWRDRAAHRAHMQRSLGLYAQSPLGLWSIRTLDDDLFHGLALLQPLEGGPEIEVGYRLLTDAWGQGIATEAGRALVRYGFEALQLGRIVGVAHPDNLASRRVLTKLGLAHRGEALHYGQTVAYYAAEREQVRRPALAMNGAHGTVGHA